MTRARRIALVVAAIVIGVAALLELAVRGVFDGDFYASELSRALEPAANVEIGSATTSALGRSIAARDLMLRFGPSRALRARSVDVGGLGWAALLGGDVASATGAARDVELITEAYRLRVDEVQASLEDSAIVIRGVRVEPLEPDSLHLRPGRPNVYRFRADSITVEGLGLGQDPTTGPVEIHRLDVHGLLADVYSDRGLAGPPGPKALPNALLASLERVVRLDSLRVAGRATYAERAPDAAEAGRVTFARLTADIGPIDTGDPELVSRLDVGTWINDAFPLVATLEWRLASPTLHMAAEGGAGAFDPRVLNSAFVDIAGIRILDGHVERVEFSFTAEDTLAEGLLHARYENLDIELVSKDDTSDKQTIPTLVAEAKIASSHMPPRDEPRAGRIAHDRAVTESIFTFLWFTLRSGIKSMVGA